MSANLEISRQGRLLEIALNRPEKRNALNLALCRELVSAIDAGGADPGIGAILLSGKGKSFCAGMDLNEITADLVDLHEQLFTTVFRLNKPLIAAVHGAALAGGTGLVANAHVAIASEDATFGLTEIRIGLWPFLIFRSVTLAIGERRAIELSLTGRIFGTTEAQAWGLVHQVMPAADLLERSREIASAIASASPAAIQSGLRYVREARTQSWAEAGRLAARARGEIFRSPEFQEKLRVFREKK